MYSPQEIESNKDEVRAESTPIPPKVAHSVEGLTPRQRPCGGITTDAASLSRMVK